MPCDWFVTFGMSVGAALAAGLVEAWRRGLQVALVLLGIPAALAAAHEPTLTVVTTANVLPYMQAAMAVRTGVEERFPAVSFPVVLEKNVTGSLPPMPSEPDDVIVAIGSAAVQALAGKTTAQLVGCMTLATPATSAARLSASLVMEFPPEVRIEWLRKILPGAHTVGLVYASAEAGSRPDALAAAAKRAGLKQSTYPVQSLAELATAIDRASLENDVIMVLADSIMMAPQSAKQLLLASFRSRVPVVGLSEPWAKAGALFALDWDFEDIGHQCAQLALKVAASSKGSLQPPIAPRKTRFVVNLRTARYMKIDMPESLLQQAAEIYQ